VISIRLILPYNNPKCYVKGANRKKTILKVDSPYLYKPEIDPSVNYYRL
jgi:hypothetical protein